MDKLGDLYERRDKHFRTTPNHLFRCLFPRHHPHGSGHGQVPRLVIEKPGWVEEGQAQGFFLCVALQGCLESQTSTLFTE